MRNCPIPPDDVDFVIRDSDFGGYVHLDIGWNSASIRWDEKVAKVYTSEDVTQAFGNFVTNMSTWECYPIKKKEK